MIKMLKLFFSIIILSGLGLVLNSNTEEENPLEGKWELDVRTTYMEFADSFEFAANEYSEAIGTEVNLLKMSAGLFKTITVDQQIQNADIHVIMSFRNNKCAIKFENVNRADQFLDYHFFGSQLSIGKSRYNIQALDPTIMVLKAKSHKGNEDYPLYFRRIQ